MLCDRMLKADPDDLDFRVYRAKALHRANLKKELAEDLDYIKQHMPANTHEAERVEKELREILVKRPSSVHPSPKAPKAEAPKAKPRSNLKIPMIAALALLLVAGGAAGYYEMTAKRDLDIAIEVSRDLVNKFLFVEARRPIDSFLEKSLSPKQKDRARSFLVEIEAKQQNWAKERREREERDRQEAVERMRALVSQIEEDRQNRPTTALQRARELREFAVAHKDSEYVRRAEELAQSLEQYLGGAFTLKAKADALEKEGKLRDAALIIDRLLTEFPNTDPARGALYPIEIVTRPAGVKITSLRSGLILGETGDTPVRYRMKPTESVRLLFEKSGYSSVERDVKDKSVGRIQVELQDKREQWVMPLGMSVSTEPAIQGDTLFITGGSRVFALKTASKKVPWYESLEGTIEGTPKAGLDRVYVGTSAQALFALDPASSAKRILWRYETGERVSGPPGLSADGATVYIATYDKMLHAVNSTTGEGIWKREIPGESRMEAVAFEGLVVVACTDGTIVAVKGARPEDEVWKYRLDSTPGPMTVSDGVIYVSGSDLGVHAIDARKGTRLWRQKMGSIVTGRIVRVNGTVCAASREGRVSFLDAASGESLWTFDAQGPIQGGVSSSGSLLLFGSDDQSVYAFDLSLRSLAWRLKVKGKVRMAPVVGKGAAFFGNDEGVYSVELN
jgi:outer membrane protein assembly factor BamB